MSSSKNSDISNFSLDNAPEYLLVMLLLKQETTGQLSDEVVKEALEYVDNLLKADSDNDLTKFNKRDFLIDISIVKELSKDELLIYNACAEVRKMYFSGDHNEALKTLLDIHLIHMKLPRTIGWSFLCLILANAFMNMSLYYYASFLCMDSIAEVNLPKYSPVRATALSFLGDIALNKRLYCPGSV